MAEPPAAATILAVAAHPDDIERWCAGTLARAVDAGAEVRLLLITAGECGSDDPTTSPAELARQRLAEAEAAGKLLGLASVEVLGYPDGGVEDTATLRRDLVRTIRRWRPEAVFTHDPEHPWPPYLSHRDHRVVGRAVLDAIYPLARDPLAFSELYAGGLHPHKVRSVWLFASTVAERIVDITPALERKLAARLAHRSQTPDPVELVRSWRQHAAGIGAQAGVAYGEAFTVLELA